jgi:propionyl-CoA carboxylase alpha chain
MPGNRFYKVRAENDLFDVRIEGTPQDRFWRFYVNENPYEVEIPEFEFYRRRLKLWIDGKVYRFRIRIEHSFIFVAFSGITRLFEIYTPKEWKLMKYMPAKRKQKAANALICPMPGLIVEVLVQKGDRVFRGQNLVILESMKMESGVASPVDGVVAEVLAEPGQAVEPGEILVKFKS